MHFCPSLTPTLLCVINVCSTFLSYGIGLGSGVFLTVVHYKPKLRARRRGLADATLTGTQVDELLADLRMSCKEEKTRA
jgi:hypothetical protein